LDDEAQAKRQAELALCGRLLHALPEHNRALKTQADNEEERADLARLLLARLAIRLQPDLTPVANSRRIRINNLERPFLLAPGLCAWLMR
jgi:hypothetical protein